MKIHESKEPTFISIIGRAFCIMEKLLLSEEPLGVSQLSRETGIPKANTFRILKTLEELKAISPEGDGYVLGSKMIELGNGAKKSDQFITLTIPFAQKLSERCRETINLGVPFKGSILVLHTELAEQRSLVALLPPIMPLHCSSIGKVFLSHQSDDQIAQYFAETELRERTVNTIMTKERFAEDQKDILDHGIAHDREEYDYGLSCMAAPIFLNGELVAGLSLSGPTSRLQFKGYPWLEEEVKAAAAAISDELTKKGAVLPDIR